MNIDFIEWSHYLVVGCILLVLFVLFAVCWWAYKRDQCPWVAECQRLRESGFYNSEYEIEQDITACGGIYYAPEIEE